MPLMYKLLTGMISEDMYGFLDENHLLPDEQKGTRKQSRRAHDLLFIDKMVMRNARARNRNLFMAWIDHRKAYHMLPHSWIKECLALFGIASNIKRLLSNCMEAWKTGLYFGSTQIGEVNISRGIFQGDALSPLLFVVTLIPLTRILQKTKCGYNLNGVNMSLFSTWMT